MSDAEIVLAMPEDEYHAHPALSSSGAKRLIQTCPAVFHWERTHGRPEKRVFDFGHAAHGLVLGIGEPLVVVDADSWRTKAAQEQQKAAYEAGHVPILTSEHEQVKAMAEALRKNPLAAALLDPERGVAEQSIFWTDGRFGVQRRARLDWRTEIGGRTTVVDYKTAINANPAAIGRKAADLGYHQQAPWYCDAVEAAGLDDDPAFVFIFQEKTAPYLCTVVEIDRPGVLAGRAANDRALEVFRDCTEAGIWPGYSDEIELISLPFWATRDLENA